MFPTVLGSSDHRTDPTFIQIQVSEMSNINKQEYKKVRDKFPDWIPIEFHPVGLRMSKTRYLAKPESLFKNFAKSIRSYCVTVTPWEDSKTSALPQQPSDKADSGVILHKDAPLFFMVGGVFLPQDNTVGQLHTLYKKGDDFLHITLTREPPTILKNEVSKSEPTTPLVDTEITKNAPNGALPTSASMGTLPSSASTVSLPHDDLP